MKAGLNGSECQLYYPGNFNPFKCCLCWIEYHQRAHDYDLFHPNCWIFWLHLSDQIRGCYFQSLKLGDILPFIAFRFHFHISLDYWSCLASSLSKDYITYWGLSYHGYQSQLIHWCHLFWVLRVLHRFKVFFMHSSRYYCFQSSKCKQIHL